MYKENNHLIAQKYAHLISLKIFRNNAHIIAPQKIANLIGPKNAQST